MQKLLFISFIVFFAIGCGQKESGISGKAPKISLNDYSGALQDFPYEKKVTLLVFWATWCQPCLMEIPALNRINTKYKEKNVNVVSINVDDPEGEKVAAISKTFKINYPVLVGDEELMKRFGGIVSLPTSFIIGPDGKIKEKMTGLYPEPILEEKLGRILASSNVSPS